MEPKSCDEVGALSSFKPFSFLKLYLNRGCEMSKWMVLVRYGEVSLKSSRTRPRMEERLSENIEDALRSFNVCYRSVLRSDGRIWVCCFDSEDEALKAAEAAAKVMGVVSVSPVLEVKFGNFDELIKRAYDFFADRVKGKVFAVRARRVGEHDFTSKDVEKALGKALLDSGALRVDLENPEYVAYVEIRDWRAYLFDKIVDGPGGLPIGTEGIVLSLVSGGIDSPVATWFAMRRGCEAHMVLCNLGGEKHVYGALRVAKVLADNWAFGYKPLMYIVDFRPLISRISLHVPEEYRVIILRRLMFKAASLLARKIGALALVTGESLGQVASQTLRNIYVIDEAAELPVLRPLIGLDKEEIVSYARRIGTYSYSIEVGEFCPIGASKTTTRASLDVVKELERRLNIDVTELEKLVDSAGVYDLRGLDIRELEDKLKQIRDFTC